MFFANVPFEYLDVTAHTALSDKFPGSFGNLTAQHLVAVLRHPYEVVLDVVNRVCARSILCHQSVIVAAPAKAVRLKAKVLDLARGNKNLIPDTPSAYAHVVRAAHEPIYL